MNDIKLRAENLGKAFIRKRIFSGINLDLTTGSSVSIAGPNGAGKTTILKVLARLLAQSEGNIRYSVGEEEINENHLYRHIGFVAPYLQLYDEFNGWENLDLMRKIRGVELPDERIAELLDRVHLSTKNFDPVRAYSSGMKQRLKYACALLHSPSVLFLDEPTANFDAEGREIARSIAEDQKRFGILVLGTNEPQEVAWCEQTVNLDTK
ncbi:MAG TPA: ABC transporter ATP-binding protein [Bacteroidota bacterium]|nr:ABC transporter ATP-binding protein [Bacteroidota bacterium]